MMFLNTLCALLLLFTPAGLFDASGAYVPQLEAPSPLPGVFCSLSFVQFFYAIGMHYSLFFHTLFGGNCLLAQWG